MRIAVIVQARTSSSRLPGKALLRVAGHPSALLAVLRAANRGHDIVLATSTEASDNALAQAAIHYAVPVFRGSLSDVLGRYHAAALKLPEDSAVVRLTGDNVVPDGRFVGELVEAFVASGAEYMATDPILSHLPYGLGGEIFLTAALRKASGSATSADDREHVGPWMKRNCRAAVYRPPYLEKTDFSYLRCTIDDEEDYRRIVRLFTGVTDPIQVPWQDLMGKLADLPGEPRFRVPYRVVGGKVHSELTLGTVQLGTNYGVVNTTGKPPLEQAIAMVRCAVAHGVTALDTARGYGDAEEILGRALSGAWSSRAEVITKLDLSGLASDSQAAQVRAKVEECISRSCQALQTNRLAIVLLHGWQCHGRWRGAAWQRLLELREEGKIRALGASVYEPTEALEALQDDAVSYLQVPMNVLDWRWKQAGVDCAALARPEVMVHARSALLQGILVSPAPKWPVTDGFSAAMCVEQLQSLARRFGRESVADLCLAFVRALPWVTSVLVGCETMEQLAENLRLFRLPKLTTEQCEELKHAVPRAPDDLLNPSKWNLSHGKPVPQP